MRLVVIARWFILRFVEVVWRFPSSADGIAGFLMRPYGTALHLSWFGFSVTYREYLGNYV